MNQHDALEECLIEEELGTVGCPAVNNFSLGILNLSKELII